MSVKVTCQYTIDKCTHGLRCSDYCEEDFIHPLCDLYIPKDDRIGATCLSYKASTAVISRTYKAVEYEEGDGLSIGKEFIPYDDIDYLALDFGDGERIFINRKETTDNEKH